MRFLVIYLPLLHPLKPSPLAEKQAFLHHPPTRSSRFQHLLLIPHHALLYRYFLCLLFHSAHHDPHKLAACVLGPRALLLFVRSPFRFAHSPNQLASDLALDTEGILGTAISRYPLLIAELCHYSHCHLQMMKYYVDVS